jgi:hypothetical protein
MGVIHLIQHLIEPDGQVRMRSIWAANSEGEKMGLKVKRPMGYWRFSFTIGGITLVLLVRLVENQDYLEGIL